MSFTLEEESRIQAQLLSFSEQERHLLFASVDKSREQS